MPPPPLCRAGNRGGAPGTASHARHRRTRDTAGTRSGRVDGSRTAGTTRARQEATPGRCRRHRANPSCPLSEPIAKGVFDGLTVMRPPLEAHDAAPAHGRECALLVLAQGPTGTLQLGAEGLLQHLVPELPVREAQAVAVAVHTQRVHALDDAL